VLKNRYLDKWKDLPDDKWERAAVKWLEKYRRDKGWDIKNPIYMREWMHIWIRSNESMVYAFDAKKNLFESFPAELNDAEWRHVMGVDIGSRDSTAMVDVSWRINDRKVYVYNCYDESGLTISEIATAIKERMKIKKYYKIMVDSGSLGKMIVEDMKERYGLPLEAAEKNKKMAAIENMNSDFYMGDLLIRRKEPIIEEYYIEQWDDDGRAEDKRYKNDLCDAALYAWREVYAYRSKIPIVRPNVGSEEYWLAEEERGWQEALSLHNKKPNDSWAKERIM
jgi:hypothetical protein